jgi:cytochrome P450
VTGSVRGWLHCREALSGEELVSDPGLAGIEQGAARNLLFIDGEVQRRLRRLVMPYFTSRSLARLEPRLTKSSRSLLASALERPQPDLVADLAEPLVLNAVLAAMEVPEARRASLSGLARGMLGMLEPELPPQERRRTKNAAMRAALLFERDGRNGRATGLHGTLEAAAAEDVIPVKLARSTPVVVLHGGYENPLNQLGCVIAWASQDPERFKEAATSAPDLLFEEVLRVFSPVRRIARWVAREGGQQPPLGGELVWVDLESANRDGRRFADADGIDLSGRRQHLGFGYGAHACPGTTLARLEGRALISALAAVPNERLGEFTVEWNDGIVARGPARIVQQPGSSGAPLND